MTMFDTATARHREPKTITILVRPVVCIVTIVAMQNRTTATVASEPNMIIDAARIGNFQT